MILQKKNYVVPNFITLLNLLCGVYAIVAAIEMRFTVAAYAILIAAIFDGLDGKVARLMKGTSEFGIQLDSLADIVSFGVAPAIVVYSWKLVEIKQFGLVALFVFTACGALRLARFNVQTKVVSNVFFIGTPIPVAAATLASWMLFSKQTGLDNHNIVTLLTFIITCLVAFLMVSTIKYFSFKNTEMLKINSPFKTIAILIALMAIVALSPSIMIFLILFAYLMSGLIAFFIRNKYFCNYTKNLKKHNIRSKVEDIDVDKNKEEKKDVEE